MAQAKGNNVSPEAGKVTVCMAVSNGSLQAVCIRNWLVGV